MTDRDEGRASSVHNDLSGRVFGNVVQADSVRDIHFHQPERVLVPAQLPPLPQSFAGRDTDLNVLARWLSEAGDGTQTVVLTGPGGVGKTALALRWMRELRTGHPDGLLFVDLAGGTENPVTSAEALDWFLLSLGIEAHRVPVDEAQRAAMYRSVTADRRLLVLLDNAVSAAQVRPLLPASEHCVVVVTSRFRLSGLAVNGAHWVDVGPLGMSEAVEVLQRIVGEERVNAELSAAQELAGLCGGLPLALTIVASRLATRPRRRLVNEVVRMRGEQQRLNALSLGEDQSVEAVFETSYVDLPADAIRLFRLCSRHPGPDFDAEVAAAALEWSADRAENALDALLEANFLLEVEDGRFGYHDLLRLYAQQRADDEDGSATRDFALRRMIEWYLSLTVAADVVIHPLRPRLGPRYHETQGSPALFQEVPDALAWLEARRAALGAAVTIAAQEHWDELVWQLCEALWGFFLHTRHYGDWIRMHQLGIAASQRIGSRRAEARLRSQLGFAYAKLGRYQDSEMENTTALRLAEAEQDIQAKATALSQLGRTARESGNLASALGYYQQAKEIQREMGQWRGVALCQRRMGQVLSKLQRHDEAAAELAAAADTMRQLGDDTQYARTLLFLAESCVPIGQLSRAGDLLRDALSLMRRAGSSYYQAEILARLADLGRSQGDYESARSSYQEAADLYAATGDPAEQVMRTRLAELERS